MNQVVSTATLSKSINATVPLRDASKSLFNPPDTPGLVLRLRSLAFQARSVAQRTWSTIRKWKTINLPMTSVRLPNTPSLALRSAWSYCANAVGRCYNYIAYRCDNNFRFFKAAVEEFEDLFQRGKKQDSRNQQGFKTSIATIPTRIDIIVKIAARADLGAEDIPSLAFIQVWAARKIVAWNHGDGLLTWGRGKLIWVRGLLIWVLGRLRRLRRVILYLILGGMSVFIVIRLDFWQFILLTCLVLFVFQIGWEDIKIYLFGI